MVIVIDIENICVDDDNNIGKYLLIIDSYKEHIMSKRFVMGWTLSRGGWL
jgi:hypothetical protein